MLVNKLGWLHQRGKGRGEERANGGGQLSSGKEGAHALVLSDGLQSEG